MKKIFLLFSLIGLLSISVLAQKQYPYVLGYSAGQSIEHKGTTAVGDTFNVSFSGGAPFPTQWKNAFGGNRGMLGFRHNLIYVEQAFTKDLFVSKGYYGDYVELKWDLERYIDQVSAFKVYRKVLGASEDSVQVASLSGDARRYQDEYAESGIIYSYTVIAEGLFPFYEKFVNYINGVGFRIPYGRISGRVTYAGGAAVSGVSIIAESEDDFGGSSVALDGTESYMVISPASTDKKFEFDTAFTFQAWVKPTSTTLSTVFQKGAQYKLSHHAGKLYFKAGTQTLELDYSEKADTFFHVTAMRSADSIKLILKYSDVNYYTASAKLTSATPANTAEIFIGKSGSSEYFKGVIDEIRLWHRSFNLEKVLDNAGMYIAGTENYLSGYYRLNENVGTNFYDLSRKGFTFYENHGYLYKTSWSTEIPLSTQLAVKGITDANGNYIISGIPYSTDGSIYRFIPVYDIHSFDPTEKLLFLGPGSTSHNNIDFIDVASFPVKGTIFYRDTYFPVSGVSIKVDGVTAVTSDGIPITTDAVGEFDIDVPIGKHFITVEKYGHGFVNNGRFPATEGDYFDFQAPYTFQQPFVDTTLIKVIGKVVGGPVQAAKPKGLGKSTANIGNATITLGTQKEYDLTNNTSETVLEVTGQWENESYYEGVLNDNGDTKYTIIKSSPKQINIEADPETGEFFAYLLPEKYIVKSVIAGSYTFGPEFRATIDLTQAYLFQTEEDTTSALGGNGEKITVTDSVGYQHNQDFIYRVSPEIDVVNKNTGESAFWESKITAKDGTEVTIVDNAGEPLTDYPVFNQRGRYKINVSVFEKYVNDDNGGIEDRVPVTDGKVEIQNALAIDQAKKSLEINSQGIASYEFLGGMPNITQGGIGDYIKTMSIIAYTGKNGSITTPWTFKGDVFKGYVLGGLPTGNNFVTTGPNQVDMILRDPFGSSSFAYYELGQSTSKTSSYEVVNENSGSEDVTFQLGTEVTTFAGVGAGVIMTTGVKADATVGIEHSETWLDNNTVTSTTTNMKRWATSAETDFVGSAGDVFIGHATNIVYGKSVFLSLIKDCADCSGTPVNGYSIGKHDAIRVNPQFSTGFMYTTNHIENYLIPGLEMLRNNILVNSSNYTSVLATGDEDFGRNNADGTNDSYAINLPTAWPDDSLFTDSIKFYNEQIEGWENLLARNEREKAEATIETNYSFDGGVVYESSVTTEESEEIVSSFEFTIAPSVAGAFGAEFNAFGMEATFQETYTHVETNEEGTETAKSVTFGYELSDGDEGDYFSVDIKKAKTPTGPVFALKGGQSQCPFEGEVVSKYYSPGTVLSESTQQREKPTIDVVNPVQTSVPEDQQAVFEVLLGNISETEDDVWFVLEVDENSNQEGAEIRLDGSSIGNGRLIRVPAGSTVKKIITVEKVKPDVFNYENLVLVLHSACQYDPTDNIIDISDSVRVTARFQPVCSKVSMPSPANLWILNTNTGTDLPIEVGDYNLQHSSFENVQFQYKPSSTSQWITDMTFYVDQAEYNSAQEPKTFIDGESSLDYTWQTEDLKDRQYNIRLLTNCADGTTNESITTTGIRDIKRPEVFGTPQPADGILSPNDDVMITFDEAIQAGLLLSTNFSVRGVLNGADIQHNSSLYFDGVDDYASVINGVNLQSSDATVEFWVQRASLGAGVILSIGQDIELGFDANNKFYAELGGTKVLSPNSYTATDEWIHYAVAYNNTTNTVNMYVNDQWVVENKAVPHTNTWSEEIHMGSDINGSNNTEMYMHDVRIWNSARGFGTTYANMSVVMSGSEIGLVGLWAMDESAGTYAPDKARSQNALLRGPAWRVFPSGYARTLNGYTDVVTIPSASSVVLTEENDYTIEFWFKGTAQTNTVLFSNGRGDNTDASPSFEDIVVIGTNSIGQLYVQNNGNVLSAATAYMDNEWHHFAFIVNRRANASIYVDGDLQAFKQSDDYGGLNGAEMAIGARMQRTGGVNIYDQHFTGKMDEFRIWGLARTATLIGMDMNAKLSGDEVGLLAYYPFDAYDINLILQSTLEDQVEGSVLTASAVSGGVTNSDVPNIKDARPAQNLSFDWVVNGDELIINVNEQPQLIEKTVLEFTVRNVEDLQENRMASPVTWTAYIKKNTLIWGSSKLDFQKKLYDEMSFSVEIQNIGGVEQNFSIKNLPSWITPSQKSGTLLPDSKQEIEFEVDPSVNIGEYDISMYLGSDFGYNEKLEVKLKVYEEAPEWLIDPSDYQYSMSLVGYTKVDGVISTNPDDQVAAFVGNECRGVANLEYIEDYDRYLVFLNIYSNAEQGEEVYFRIWNASEGIEHINITPELQFVSNDLIGTPANPQLLETNNSYNNRIYLPSGWKWISINLEDPDLNDCNAFLSDLSSESGDQVKGQLSFANYDPFIGWNGSLNSTGMNNKEMYLVKSKAADTLEFSGQKVDVMASPITIEKGWNWIGYPPQVNIELNQALGNYDAANGDIFKSQYAFAVYDDILGWIGNLDFLKPGEGYMFRTANTASNLIYPENGMSALRTASSLRVAVPSTSAPWVVNDVDYPFNMSVIATLSGVVNEEYEVGAFVNGECRGKANGQTYQVDGRDVVLYFVTVHGTSNDKINFKIYDKSTGDVVDATEELTFITNGVEGTSSNPYPIGQGVISGIDFMESSFDVKGYPNPFEKEFVIEFSRAYVGEFTYEVIDVMGKIVSSGVSELDASRAFRWKGQTDSGKELPAGVYTISLQLTSGTKSITVIKI